MSVPGWMLLRLEQGVKVPEAALHVVVRRHLCQQGLELKAHLAKFIFETFSSYF
jgi:hypothetical protein